jgi:hypothetical protein
MDINSKEFKKLQAEWYKKLSDSGFQDIEDSGPESMENSYHAGRFKQRYPLGDYRRNRCKESFNLLYRTQSDYYRYAAMFANDYKFINPTEKYIWEKHCEGIAIRKICADAKEVGIKLYVEKVANIIKRLKNIMIKDYINDMVNTTIDEYKEVEKL